MSEHVVKEKDLYLVAYTTYDDRYKEVTEHHEFVHEESLDCFLRNVRFYRAYKISKTFDNLESLMKHVEKKHK